VVGPMARSARDLRLLLSVLEAGALAARTPAPPELGALRVGLWINQPEFGLDPEVRAVLEAFGEELRAQGAQVTPISSPVEVNALMSAYRTLLAGVLAQDLPSAQLTAFQRIRPAAKLALTMGAGPDSWAAMALDYTASHLDWMAADEARARIAAQARSTFARFDVIVAPINPVPAFPHDHRPFQRRTLTLSDGSTTPYLAMLRWIALATACGLPATAIPVGQTPGGLPVGAQLIGPRGADARTIGIAEAIEERLGGFVAPPPLEAAPS
jgi:amidase